MDLEKMKYPIGRFSYPDSFNAKDIELWINEIEAAPRKYKALVQDFPKSNLDKQYREDGWSARQILHHVPVSHIQAFCRFKWVLTEEGPTTIKPYMENKWAELPDVAHTPVEVSLQLLEAIHQRWVILMRHMDLSEFDLFYIHPEYGKKFALGAASKLYAWHGAHHLAHLQLIAGK